VVQLVRVHIPAVSDSPEPIGYCSTSMWGVCSGTSQAGNRWTAGLASADSGTGSGSLTVVAIMPGGNLRHLTPGAACLGI